MVQKLYLKFRLKFEISRRGRVKPQIFFTKASPNFFKIFSKEIMQKIFRGEK